MTAGKELQARIDALVQQYIERRLGIRTLAEEVKLAALESAQQVVRNHDCSAAFPLNCDCTGRIAADIQCLAEEVKHG